MPPSQSSYPGYPVPDEGHSRTDDSTLPIIFGSVIVLLLVIVLIISAFQAIKEIDRRRRAARAEGLQYGAYEERFPTSDGGYRHRKLELLETIASRLEGIESSIDELRKDRNKAGKWQQDV